MQAPKPDFKIVNHYKDLTNANFANVTLERNVFAYCTFRLANLQIATLSNSIFEHCDFSNANLYNATINQCVFKNCKFRPADFESAHIRDTLFDKCRFGWINLANAIIDNVTLPITSLNGSRFKNTTIKNCKFKVHEAFPWNAFITQTHIDIGCKHHTIKQWSNFSDDEINNMNPRALAYWKNNRDAILALAQG